MLLTGCVSINRRPYHVTFISSTGTDCDTELGFISTGDDDDDDDKAMNAVIDRAQNHVLMPNSSGIDRR